MSAKALVEVDLRVPNGACITSQASRQLYTHDEHAMRRPADPFLPDCVYEYHAERERLCHCLSVGDAGSEALLLTTTRRHLLIDRRMPNVVLLSMGHTEMDGSDYCVVVGGDGSGVISFSLLS